MRFEDEIETLVRARYPLVAVVTFEEQRAIQILARVAERRQKALLEWSCTTGMVPAGTSVQSQKARTSPTRDPLAALDLVIDHVEPAIFVMKDLHASLGRQNPAVVRRLRDIAIQLKNSPKTVVLLSPQFDLPQELEKELTVLHLPLPTREDIEALLDAVIRDLHDHRDVQIELAPDSREHLIQAALGLTIAEAENVFARILVRHGRLDGSHVGEVLEEKQQIVRKGGLLEYYAAGEPMDEVGGLGHLKEWLRKRSAALTPEAARFGLPAPRGVLLVGVQGCGKSLCAKAIASLWQLPLLRFDIGRMFGSLVGSSEENIRRAIATAQSVAPAVLWVDEIDKAFSGARGSGSSDGGTTARVFGSFLTWLSEKTCPVFVVATANEISDLPPELLRKGRFDEIFFVDLPQKAERREIFGIHLTRRGRAVGDFDLEALAAASEEFSGSEIEQAVISALFDAFADRKELDTRALLAALGQTVPLARTMAEQIRELRAWAQHRARRASELDPVGGGTGPESPPFSLFSADRLDVGTS